jgi:hypothetical protein
MNPLIQLKTTPPLLITLTLLCFGLLPGAQAVVPPPDGGYPGGNTAEGQNALFSLTSGGYNTAVGFFSLRGDSTGNFNTAIGVGTLLANTADDNTATGAAALLSNSTGSGNTANGYQTLFNNTTGFGNMASGYQALYSNTGGILNTAFGALALTANANGSNNTAIGQRTLFNSTGNDNTAIGSLAGSGITGSSNVCIGANVSGDPGVSNACYIGGIFVQTSAGGAPVFVNVHNQLGTMTSSKRFKEEIKPVDKASEALFELKPVTFHYRKEIDPKGTSQFGLVAEDVEKVNPDLVVRDKEGKPYSVRYDQVNAMLLNEFLKEHKAFVQEQRKVQELEKQIEKLAAGLHKVSAQLAAASPSRGGLEAGKPAPQVVNNP